MKPPRILDGRLKIRHLRLVTEIADQCSIAGAADALGVSQPVVTRGLQELEAILGVSLFVRQARGVTPTVAGRAFVQHARNVLTQLQTAASEVDDLATGRAGSVAIGTHLAGSNLLLPRAVRAYRENRPEVVVIIREGTPSALSAMLLGGEIDLIVGRLVPSPETDQLVQVPLYREPIRLVVGKHHPLAQRSGITLAETTDFPWIFPDTQTALRHELEQVFLNAGIPLPRSRVECTSILTIRTLLIESPSVAALPFLISSGDSELAVLDTFLPGVSRTVGVTRRRQSVLSSHSQDFIVQLETAALGLRRELNIGPDVGPVAASSDQRSTR